MKRFRALGIACLFTAAELTVLAAGAQSAPQNSPSAAQTNSTASPAAQQSAALNASDAVPDGTHFLVRLNDALNTGKDRPGRKFTVTIIEPLETGGGGVLPPGSKITGHISRIESASITGRARLWLTFDDINAPGGRVPIVAEVSGVPSQPGVKPDVGREGEVEAQHGSAAAVGAAVGGAAGGGRGVAEGAIAGGAIAFLASRHYAHEIELPKGTRLDLVLDRPLYITQP
jgi:hypothetical protein